MLSVRYDKEADIMVIDTKPEISIAVSSSVDFGLVADFGSEAGCDVVGIELHSVGKLLAPFAPRPTPMPSDRKRRRPNSA